MRVAKGSSGELRSQLYGCLDRGFIDEREFAELKHQCEQLSGKQRSFMDYLKRVNEAEAQQRRSNRKS